MAPSRQTLGGRYILESRIASGGMATVWRARDDVLDRSVAVKILHHHLARDEEFVKRFKLEALAAARLAHPNIVAIYDSGSQPNGPDEDHYIVMEYCGGGTIKTLLDDSGAASPDTAIAMGTTICDALGYAHRAGIVHRDIKPANVLLSEDGTIKVGDFGIAKAAFAGSDITTTGSILGTVTYLAPEQLEGMEPDLRSDIYSLGVLLYELLTGRPPFVGESQLATALKHQREAPPPLRSLRVRIPKGLEAIVLRALEKEPDRRYGSVEEMRSALERQTGSGATLAFALRPPSSSESPAEEPARPVSPGSAIGWLTPVLIVIVLGLLLVLGLPLILGEGIGSGPRDGNGAGNGEPATTEIQVRSSRDFDPYGGDGEHPEAVSLATDGERETAWRTSTYQTSLDALGKPGVGLLFDLGRARDVSRIQIVTDTPGMSFEIRNGDQPTTDETGLDLVGKVANATATSVVRPPDSTARFWLVWITSLPGGAGGSGHIAEVQFFGT